MRLLLDTNVVLDVLLAREPFWRPASQLFELARTGEVEGLLGATTVTTIAYLCRKALGPAASRERLGQLLQLFAVAPVDAELLEAALLSRLEDFEDAVLHQAGLKVGVEAIVTRDATGFRRASVDVYTPAQVLSALRSPRR